jgi:hypothetical protein
MTDLLYEHIQKFQAETFRTVSHLRLRSPDQAVIFVNQRGFIFFWPNKNLLLPSLWVAVAGDRPVPNEHDDPGHITWGWKDGMLGKRRWYYGRTIRKRNAMISLEVAPFFYVLSENYGSPEEDYLYQYEQGRMTQEAKAVYEALLREGALDTISLRKAARLSSRDADGRFDKALGDLQSDFKILPVGIAEAGAWRYAYIYDLVPRHFPEIPEKARYISENNAREELALLYLQSLGAYRKEQLSRMFKWRSEETDLVIQGLKQKGVAQTGIVLSDQPGEWTVLCSLLSTR